MSKIDFLIRIVSVFNDDDIYIIININYKYIIKYIYRIFGIFNIKLFYDWKKNKKRKFISKMKMNKTEMKNMNFWKINKKEERKKGKEKKKKTEREENKIKKIRGTNKKMYFTLSQTWNSFQ